MKTKIQLYIYFIIIINYSFGGEVIKTKKNKTTMQPISTSAIIEKLQEKNERQEEQQSLIEQKESRKLIEQEENRKLIEQEEKRKLIEQEEKRKLIEQEKKRKLIEQEEKRKLIEQEKKRKLIEQEQEEKRRFIEQEKNRQFIEQEDKRRQIEREEKLKKIEIEKQEKEQQRYNLAKKIYNENPEDFFKIYIENKFVINEKGIIDLPNKISVEVLQVISDNIILVKNLSNDQTIIAQGWDTSGLIDGSHVTLIAKNGGTYSYTTVLSAIKTVRKIIPQETLSFKEFRDLIKNGRNILDEIPSKYLAL